MMMENPSSEEEKIIKYKRKPVRLEKNKMPVQLKI